MRKIDWTTSLFLFLTPLASLICVPWYIKAEGWHWSLFFLLLLFWALTEVSITAGYHRFMAHRSYDAKWWVKLFYLVVGAAAFQGSALKWGSDHRRHHRFVDTEKDPYNIKNGFWYAHIGWLLLDTEEQYKNKFYAPLAILTGFGLPILAGALVGRPWGGLIFAGFLRIVLAHHCTFFINSLCHTLGRQPYNDSHSARDSFIMAILTFGEGYHNFHHEFQIDYRNGVRWYQWDPTKWFIKANSLLGWATKLKKVPREAILRAAVLQDAKRLSEKGFEVRRLEELKSKVLQAQDDLKKLRADWLLFKNEFKRNSHERFFQLKADLRITSLEFKKSHAQWKAYVKTMSATPVPVPVSTSQNR
jgi:stearoyl-CoA desaturase (delta-9 desaturase)